MFPRLLIALSVAVLVAATAAQEPVGTFRGSIRPSKSVPQIPKSGLPVSVTLEADEDGYLEGSMEVMGNEARLRDVEEEQAGRWVAETAFMGIGTVVRFSMVDDALVGTLKGGGFTVDFRAERWEGASAAAGVAPTGAVAIDELAGEDWFEDLEFLENRLPELHMDWFDGLTADDWKAAVDRLWKDFDQLEPVQIVVRMAQLVAMRGDSHTTFSLTSLPEFASCPVAFEIFEGEVFVRGIDSAHRDALGARVVKFGETATADVLRAVATVRASENTQWERGNARLLSRPALLYGLGITESRGSLPLVIDQDGGERAVVLSAGNTSMVWAAAGEGAPLWQTRTRETYWFEMLDDGTLYFAYNQCWSDPGRPFIGFATELVEAVHEHRPDRIFVDLRNNGGGGSRVLEPVVDWLASHPVLNDPSRLFVAIGKGTFSSAMLNAVHFRERTAATLLGEPTGGKPNAYGEVRMVRLPRSGIGVWFSTKYFESVPGNPPSVDPDRRIDLTAADYFAGRDPVLAFARGTEPQGAGWEALPAPELSGVWRGRFEAPRNDRDALPGGALDFALAVVREDDGTVNALLETVLHPEPLVEASYDAETRALTGRIALAGMAEAPVIFSFGDQTVRAVVDTGVVRVEGTGLRMAGQDVGIMFARGEFEQLAAAADVDGARVVAERLVELWRDDASALNTFAWRLLTEQPYEGHFDAVARAAARRCNELSEHGNWRHLDTLALAEFESGAVEEAIRLERKALELVDDAGLREDLEEALRKFEAALAK